MSLPTNNLGIVRLVIRSDRAFVGTRIWSGLVPLGASGAQRNQPTSNPRPNESAP